MNFLKVATLGEGKNMRLLALIRKAVIKLALPFFAH